MDPGRSKIEERDIRYVAVGDIVLDSFGGNWEVYEVMRNCLMTERRVASTDKQIFKMFKFQDYPNIRCRVELGPTR